MDLLGPVDEARLQMGAVRVQDFIVDTVGRDLPRLAEDGQAAQMRALIAVGHQIQHRLPRWRQRVLDTARHLADPGHHQPVIEQCQQMLPSPGRQLHVAAPDLVDLLAQRAGSAAMNWGSRPSA